MRPNRAPGKYSRIFAQIGKIIHDFLYYFKQFFKILYFLNFL